MQRSSHFVCRSIQRKRIPNGPAPSIFWPFFSLVGQDAPAKSICPARLQAWDVKRTLSSSASTRAIIENYVDENVISEPSTVQCKQPQIEPIRNRLRSWEDENPYKSDLNFRRTVAVNKPKLNSIFVSPEGNGELYQETERDVDVDRTDQPMIEDGELVDFGNQRTFLARGDLVELRVVGGRGSNLAMYVRRMGTESLFYSISGEFILNRTKDAIFSVPGFVEPCELDQLSSFVPDLQLERSDLIILERALPNAVGSTLVKKMKKFRNQSDACYRAASSELDHAHQLLARKSTLRYATLHEIAHELLGEKHMRNGEYTIPMLYAVHRSLLTNDVCFRAQSSGWHRVWGQFEITSQDDRDMIDFVTRNIRKYQAHLVAAPRGDKSQPPRLFLNFLAKARKLIDESRETRNWTPYGMIGPLERSRRYQQSPGASAEKSFESEENLFVRFIFVWTCMDMFGKASHLHSIAATILKATGKYEDQVLEKTLGWTFLQEIGVIAPWENKVQFRLRLSKLEPRFTEADGLGPDVVESLRKDWGSLRVYCIDNSDAHEIDDGVSIESADLPDEYWIHIHTADPASGVVPRSAIGKKAESMIRSAYLPERKVSMLPNHVHEKFSLAPNRPCLTFSARLNCRGDLLEEKITPGFVRNVVFLTPPTVSSVVKENIPTNETVLALGDRENQSTIIANRPLLEEQDMTEVDKENLILLHNLGSARETLSSLRGGVDFNRAQIRLSVGLEREAVSVNANQFTSDRQQKDPYVQLRADRWEPGNPIIERSTVKNLMLLAGEVAARWCHARGVPIINQVSQVHRDEPDPRAFFRESILPIMQPRAVSSTPVSDSIPPALLRKYMELLGTIVPSTTVGPHLALGLEMFTRATSPLRRYSDLVLHWQVEAALLEEKRLGRSLVGSSAEDFLPYTKDQLEQLIPYVSAKERALYEGTRDANRFWAMYILLRAWQHNAIPLPPTFEVIVTSFGDYSINCELLILGGERVGMDFPTWMPLEDINTGDIFEVKIRNINIDRLQIHVEPLRLLKSESGIEGDGRDSASTA